MSIELQVIELEVLPVEFNFDEIKLSLTEIMEKYNNLVVTEESIVEGKKTRAELNNLAKELNSKAIAIDKKRSEPIKLFRGKINELIDIIKIPCGKIDSQIKQFEDDERIKKGLAIGEIFEELKAQIKESIPEIKISQIDDDKWLNATVSLKSIRDNMTDKINALVAGYVCIANFKSDFEVQLLDMYTKNNNLALVLSEKDRLEKIKAENEARKLTEAEKTKAQEVETVNTGMANMFEVKQPAIEVAPIVQQPIAKTVAESEKTAYIVKITVSDSQLLALDKYLLDNNIAYEMELA